MTRYRLLLAAAVGSVLAGCTQAPTAPAKAAATNARFDGGNTMGSGNSVPTDSTQRGGNTMGGGG
jgi:hypothetical protein